MADPNAFDAIHFSLENIILSYIFKATQVPIMDYTKIALLSPSWIFMFQMLTISTI